MPSRPHPREEIPPLAALGPELVLSTGRQRWQALLRPFLCLGLYAAAAWAGAAWLGPPIVFLLFVAVVTVTHDLVHGSLGLGARATEWALLVYGALLLESGHAYRLTHHRHHAVFPGPDDPEGDPARLGFWQAVLHGPLFLPRLWLWAFRKSRGSPEERCWLAIEAAIPVSVVALAVVIQERLPSLLVYAVLAIGGSWVYPLLTVHLPHRNYGRTPLTQTHTLRGRIVPALFLELTYHLEHHLYPMVPSHNLPELSRRLEGVFQRAGVRPRRVP